MRERVCLLFFLGFFFVCVKCHAQNILLDKKPRIVLFFSLECPICQRYVQELNRIYNDYSSQVEFEVVVPEKSEWKQVRKFTSAYEVDFSINPDKNGLTRSLNPSVTPEVFLFDSKGKRVYQGAIDNWFYELGKYRPEPSEFYLRNAIESLLTGSLPRIERTEAIGCMISTQLKHDH